MTSKAVLFHLDGTLIVSKSYHILAWRKLFHLRGHRVSEGDILRTFGQTSPHIIQMLLPLELNSKEVAALASEKEELFRYLIRDELTPASPSERLVAHPTLHHVHYGIALATQRPQRMLEWLLEF